MVAKARTRIVELLSIDLAGGITPFEDVQRRRKFPPGRAEPAARDEPGELVGPRRYLPDAQTPEPQGSSVGMTGVCSW